MKQSPLLKERLIEQLRSQIALLQSDRLVKIPSERSLAESLEASRVSVRAAIRELCGEGLLVQLRGKGTYIVPAVRVDTLYLFRSPDIKGHDPFYNSFLVEITNAAAMLGIKLAMLHPERPLAGVPRAPIVVIGQAEDSLLDELASGGGILFAVQRYAHRDDLVQIYFDDYQIGSKAAKTLYERGHRSAALLGGPDKYPSANLRRLGFLDKARQDGLEVRTVTEKMNWEGGVLAADTLLEAELPDAVFAVNDWMAAGLIQRLRERGRRVPADISVIGCDDIPLASELTPRLATFSLDMLHLTRELLSAVQRHATDGAAPRDPVVLSAVFADRESLTSR